MTSTKTTRAMTFSVSLSPELHEKAKDAAMALHLSLAAFVRIAVESQLGRGIGGPAAMSGMEEQLRQMERALDRAVAEVVRLADRLVVLGGNGGAK